MRIPTQKEYSHERLGERFRTALSAYDTQRRLDVLIDRFLAGKLEGRTVLEVGAGLGFFSQRLQQRGASVTATDIGESMLQHVTEGEGDSRLPLRMHRCPVARGAFRAQSVRCRTFFRVHRAHASSYGNHAPDGGGVEAGRVSPGGVMICC